MMRKAIKCNATLGGELIFPKKYLAFEDLRGQDAAVTIESVRWQNLERADDEIERRAVLSFVGKKKKMILNKTNTAMTEKVLGSRGEEWVGKRLTLYPTRDRGWDCIRIRDRTPTAPSDATPPASGPPTESEQAAIRTEESNQ